MRKISKSGFSHKAWELVCVARENVDGGIEFHVICEDKV